MSTTKHTYADELLYALRVLDVPGPRIAEALAEVDSHVVETGEDPHEAFGPPRQYAAEVAAALGRPGTPQARAVAGGALTYGVGSTVASWLLLDGALSLGSGEPALLGLPGIALVLLGLAGGAVLLVGMWRLAHADDVAVRDPRDGAEMTPALPRWVAPVMVAPPVLLVVAAIAVAVASR